MNPCAGTRSQISAEFNGSAPIHAGLVTGPRLTPGSAKPGLFVRGKAGSDSTFSGPVQGRMKSALCQPRINPCTRGRSQISTEFHGSSQIHTSPRLTPGSAKPGLCVSEEKAGSGPGVRDLCSGPVLLNPTGQTLHGARPAQFAEQPLQM